MTGVSAIWPPYRKTDSALVDGERWYTVKCNNEVAEWIRAQPNYVCQWYERGDYQQWYILKNKFDINEKIYIQIGLKWSRS